MRHAFYIAAFLGATGVGFICLIALQKVIGG